MSLAIIYNDEVLLYQGSILGVIQHPEPWELLESLGPAAMVIKDRFVEKRFNITSCREILADDFSILDFRNLPMKFIAEVRIFISRKSDENSYDERINLMNKILNYYNCDTSIFKVSRRELVVQSQYLVRTEYCSFIIGLVKQLLNMKDAFIDFLNNKSVTFLNAFLVAFSRNTDPLRYSVFYPKRYFKKRMRIDLCNGNGWLTKTRKLPLKCNHKNIAKLRVSIVRKEEALGRIIKEMQNGN